MEEFVVKFMPRFVELARERIGRAIAGASAPDYGTAQTTLRDMHAIVGEAGLLGLARLLPLARTCEEKARAMCDTRSHSDAAAVVDSLRELDRAIELLGVSSAAPAS